MCTENNSTDLKIYVGMLSIRVQSEDSSFDREVCKLPIEKYHSSRKDTSVHEVWNIKQEKRIILPNKIYVYMYK